MPELLVACAIAVMTAATGMALLSIAARTQPGINDRAAQIQQGRAMIERMAQELRQGESIFNPTSSSFDVLTLVNSETCGGVPAPSGMPCRVTYSCTSTACSRTERDPDGGGTSPPKQLVEGIMGPAVFTFSPVGATDPTYVTVTLSFRDDDGAETVTLRDGVALRNHIDANPQA
jgi:hypothetical protein